MSVVLVTLMIFRCCDAVQAQPTEVRLTQSSPALFDEFGHAVALSGGTLLVGVPQKGSQNEGTAYTFTKESGIWSQQQQLVASDISGGDNFAHAVAIDGGRIVIGSIFAKHMGNSAGAAYVFEWNGATWVEQQKLIPLDLAQGDGFGTSVAVSGDTIVVGSPTGDHTVQDSGTAYVFQWNGASWNQQQELNYSNPQFADRFGADVEIFGDTIVVGAFVADGASQQSGAAVVFNFDGTSWLEQQRIFAADGALSDWFGWAVGVDPSGIIVGAYQDNPGAANAGSAYSFIQEAPNWIEAQKLTPPVPSTDLLFGYSIALQGGRLVVGVPRDDERNFNAGAAHVFQNIGGVWSEEIKLMPAIGPAGDEFGRSVAVSGNIVAVGAPFATGPGGVQSGFVFVFEFDDSEPTVSLTVPSVAMDYGLGDVASLEWTTSNIDPVEMMILSMKRDIVPPSQTEPDGVDWIRFTEDTPNDGDEIVTIPISAAIASDWRFYIRHASSGVFDATDFTFSVIEAPTLETDLSVILADNPDPVMVGGNLTYSTTVENLGPDDASGITLIHTIVGSATTFVSTNQQSICSELNRVVTCAIGDLATGVTYPSVEIVVSADEPGTIMSAADVSGTEPDPDPSNNTAQEPTQVVGPASADLSATVMDDNDPVLSGSDLTYTIMVANAGPDTAQSVSVDSRDDPPGEFNPLSGAAGTGTVGCSEDPFGFPVCSLGDIEPGGSRPYTLTGIVRLDSGMLSLEVEVMSPTSDPDTSNNLVIESTAVEFMEIEIVDVNPDFLTHNGQIITDSEVLSVGGEPRIGAAADGLTPLLLRASVSTLGTVEFSLDGGLPTEDGGLDAVGGSGRFSSVEVSVLATSQGLRAYSRYRVPDEFNRGSDDDATDRTISLNVEYTPSNSPTGLGKQVTLKLVRPPLVMIHGLWSSGDTWRFPLATDDRFPYRDFADYALLSSNHFATNAGAPFASTYGALTRARQEGIAATQVDVIGHSMGGILARNWTNALPYRGKRNLYAGDFRKLITLDTPHAGSPAASILNVFRTDPLHGTVVRNKMRVAGYPIDDGAIEDLSLGSQAIANIQGSSVPAHAVVGQVDLTELSDLPEALGISYTLLQFLGVALDVLFDEFHDGLVGQTSQEGGLEFPAVTYFGEQEGGMHLDNSSSAFYSNAARILLDTPVTSSVFSRFPEPRSLPLAPTPAGVENLPYRILSTGLEITQPAPGSVVEAGEAILVVVEETGGSLVDKVLLISPSSAEVDSSSPFEFQLHIPAESLGVFTITAVGRNGSDELFSTDDVLLSAETFAQILSVDVSPANLLLFGSGYSRQIRVLGNFDDGIARDISASALGTVYSVADSDIAAVSLEGLVTAVDEGITVVTIENGGLQGEVIVDVVPSLPIIFFDGFESGSTNAWSTTNSN